MATSTATTGLHFKAGVTLFTLTGDRYDEWVRRGVFRGKNDIELLEGHLILKTPVGPSHDNAVSVLTTRLVRMNLSGWMVRSQNTAKLTESRPEPDVALARGDERTFANRHPDPEDFGLVVEVADSSLARDEHDKTRIYARDSIPAYWVVNLVDRRVEVFTDPTGPDPAPGLPGGDDPHYQVRHDYPAGTAVPVVLDGVTVGTVAVDELLP